MSGPHESAGARPARQGFAAFVADADAARVLKAVFGPALPTGFDLHQVPFQGAVEHLRRIETPATILVDVSGEDQPLTAILQLESVVDPGTRVLVTGDSRSVSFYRALTRNLGVKEYLPKPLDSASVAREFLPWAIGEIPETGPARGGAMIAFCGVRGGVGVTTLAANLAWLIGAETHRHTILLDTDLHHGCGALALNVPPSTGLRTALETPDRIDPLLIERAAHPAAERLHVLAAEEPLTEKFLYRPGGGRALSAALRQRYNFVIADIPARPFGFATEILGLAQEIVLVTDATREGIVRARRWIERSAGTGRTTRPIVAVNRYRRRRQMMPGRIETLLGTEIGVTVPDVAGSALRAADLGEVMAVRKGKFHDAMVRLARAANAGPAMIGPAAIGPAAIGPAAIGRV